MSEERRAPKRVALVSGAAGGIAGAIIAALEDEGVASAGFDAKSRPASGGGERASAWFEGDVRNDDDVKSAVLRTIESLGRLDYVIHAAGVTRDRVLWKLPPPDWDLVLEVNLKGAFLLLRHAVPVLREGGGGGIVLIGSINGSRGKFGQSAYAASKAGLVGLAKSAARETGRFGIRVNVLEPGMVRTAMTDRLPAEVISAAEEESLLGGISETADIAGAVRFLCGDGAKRITGQVIRVDGGQYL